MHLFATTRTEPVPEPGKLALLIDAEKARRIGEVKAVS
jgi:hypothetical protein